MTQQSPIAFDLDGWLRALESDQATLRCYLQHRDDLDASESEALTSCNRVIKSLTACIANKKALIKIKAPDVDISAL